MKQCRRARKALEAQWAGDLEISERLWWEAHCTQCRACEKDRLQQGALSERLSVYREAPLHRVDVDAFTERLLETLPERSPQAAPAPTPARSLSTRLAAAAVVMLVGGASFWIWKSDPVVPQQERVAEEPESVGTPVEPRALAAADPLFEPATEEGDPLDRKQIENVVAELRDGFALEQSDARWTQQLLTLRQQGWPLANLFARIAREGDAAQAERAVAELARIDTNTARLHLWKLRTSAPAAGFAVSAMLQSTPFPVERVARLYWEEGHRQRVREGVGHVRGQTAIELANCVLERAPRAAVEAALIEDLGQWLAQADDAGAVEALAWWSDQRLPDRLWVQSFSHLAGLGTAIQAQIDGPSTLRSQRRMLALAHELPGSHWTEWVASQSHKRELHQPALAALALQPGVDALQSLWSLRDAGVTDRELWLECWAQVLKADSSRVMQAWDAIQSEGGTAELYAFTQSLLMAGESLEPVALATIGVHPELPMEWVFEALERIESMDSETARTLADGLAQIPAEDTQRAAAIWVALSKAGGEPALLAALELAEEEQPTRAQARLLERTQTNTPRSFRERCYLIERRLQRVRANRSIAYAE